MTNLSADHYTYKVRWSAEDGCYVGTAAEMPSLSWSADNQVDAFVGIRTLVADILDDMITSGETPPAAIADRSHSGKFMVRVTPEVHRKLAIDAAEQNVSINRLISGRLVG
jgi:predicted HicB family RNase H-like nuclease